MKRRSFMHFRLKGNVLRKAEMEYNGKFGHTMGRIHTIALMSRIGICYKA